MRAEIDVAGVPPSTSVVVERRTAPGTTPVRRRPDWFELLVLGAFAVASVWVLALDLYQMIAHGRVWTGTDGIYIVDQLQYLAWIQDAAHHLLSSNLFVLRPTPADYFQPAVAISGGLTALGMAPWLALLLWKPVAVLGTFYGVRGYAHRSFQGTWARRSALLLGLFFGSFTVIYGSVGVLGDLFPAFFLWGYTFGLLALAAMLFALFAYERARARARTGDGRAIPWAPALLGALASLLHPWQGELLILIIVATELTLWHGDPRTPRRIALPLATVLATGAPLAYYAILGRADLSWRLANVASMHSFSLATILLALLPLLLPALLAVRRRSRSFMATVTRIWPLAALAIYLLSATDVSTAPLHAFEGITIPLSVLAIEGLERAGFGRITGRRAIMFAGLAIATIPATVYELHSVEPLVAPQPGNANFITGDEQRALQFLASDPQPGGVLTQFYLGAAVPGETGRKTYVGDCVWSEPNCSGRAELAQRTFDGSLAAASVRSFVRQIGARFLLADCQTSADMAAVLAPLTQSVHRFGCAAVYELRSVSRPTGALAQSAPNAALRASGRNQRRVQHG
jgi:hypothetical protein